MLPVDGAGVVVAQPTRPESMEIDPKAHQVLVKLRDPLRGGTRSIIHRQEAEPGEPTGADSQPYGHAHDDRRADRPEPRHRFRLSLDRSGHPHHVLGSYGMMQDMDDADPERVIIGFAHRGARAHAPENTIEAFLTDRMTAVLSAATVPGGDFTTNPGDQMAR